MLYQWLVILWLNYLVNAIPTVWDDSQLRHRWDQVPAGWQLQGDADPEAPLLLQLRLAQPRFAELVKALQEVSHPYAERYGSHLSKKEANDLAAPDSHSTDVIDLWLLHHGIELTAVRRSPAGDSISVPVKVRDAEAMLNARYQVFHKGNSSIVRTLEYSLPKALINHVDLVTPTTYFGDVRGMLLSNIQQTTFENVMDIIELTKQAPVNGTVPSKCNSVIAPLCLEALYNLSGYIPQAISTNKIGILGFLEEYANYRDLQKFFQFNEPEVKDVNFTVVQVNNGGNNQARGGKEANLDIQYTEILTRPTPNIFYSVGGRPPYHPSDQIVQNTNEPYLEWLDYVLNQTDIPQTVTISYGEDEQTVPRDYAITVCNKFAQLAARGVSVLVASGDFGVGKGSCHTNDGTNRTQFQPNFPATCPFVTAVGATTQVNPEVGFQISGGGFSNYFQRPAYQGDAVANYLDTLGGAYAGLFNTSGRAFPDIAAQGSHFVVVIDNAPFIMDGTSASAPVVASIIALLNDFRIAAGKPSLGFLNPLLYMNGSAGLNDITSGSNPGCNTPGFNATRGWDPVTGLGTADFRKLQALV